MHYQKKIIYKLETFYFSLKIELSEQYKKQGLWRNWDVMVLPIPINKEHSILDLGCGVGTATKILAGKAKKIIGIDIDDNLLSIAKENARANVVFYKADLRNLESLHLDRCDGIWSSFTPAYFPNFLPIIKHWATYLVIGGWISLVEIDNMLLGHHPLPKEIRIKLAEFQNHQFKADKYDFNMGSKLSGLLRNISLEIVSESLCHDKELTFQGPASPEVLKAWELRFERLKSMYEYFGNSLFRIIKEHFLNCLASTEHTNDSSVIQVIAKKT